jgi:PAS domain S-box-containing protein
MVLLPDLRVRQRDYLLEITRAMTAQLDVGEVLRLILRASVTMLAGEVGLIALREDGDAALRVRALIGVNPDQIEVFAPLLSNVHEGRIEGLNAPEFDAKLRRIGHELGMSLRQGVALPMKLGNEHIGVIYVFRTFSGTATRNDVRVLQSFADQAAIAVHNARLYQQANRERQRLESILEHNADGVMILDADRGILSFNKAMSRISGWQPDTVIGRFYEQVVQWASRPEGVDLLEAMDAGWPVEGQSHSHLETLYVEGDIRRPDGTAIGVGITHAPLVDAEGRLINIIVNVRDISHFREAQQMKSTFISVMSHELKTPVALIKGYAGTLRREDANWDPAVVQQSLQVIEEESDRLNDLIENLLATSKLQAEGMRLNYSDVALNKIMHAVVERFQIQTKHHQFVVEFPPDFPVVPGDESRLRQVIDNLVSNAVKYSPDGCTIHLGGAYTEDVVRITVQDQGVGLPQDEWDRVFERFYRVDDALTSKAQGTGLGLYLAKAVVEAHGGEIGVTSVPGQGSTFYFTIPRHQAYRL